MANYGPHQSVCSAQGSRPVKIGHNSISHDARSATRLVRITLLLALAFSALAALAKEQLQTVTQVAAA